MKKIFYNSKKNIFNKYLFIFLIFFINSIANKLNVQNITSLSSMLEKVLPAVVSIHVEGLEESQYFSIPKEFKYFFGPNFPNNKRKFEGLGSGVIINSRKGHIVTNYHVINGAEKILVQFNNGHEYIANLIGYDEEIDLALIKVNNSENLVEIPIANSDNIKVGDFSVAIGNPFGIGQTVTSGIISAIGRSGLNLGGLENFIQTDAAINKGNSGGALINLNGELIGINTAILAPGEGNIGIGFAIPSNIVKNLSNQFLMYGEVRKGQLGIKGIELTNDIAKAFGIKNNQGAFVSEVLPNSASKKAGIKAGDIIISVNDKKIKSFSELRAKIITTPPGEKIKIGLLRNEKIFNICLTLNYDNTGKIKETLVPFLKGTVLSDSKQKILGVKIEEIDKDSPATYHGLQINDIIIGVNKEKIDNIKQLHKIFRNKLETIVVNIIRGNSSIFLLIN
ncbi:MAG: Do family serine endopeptidase [Enterobacteriaceae bacterium]